MYLYVRAHTVDRCKLPIKMKIQGQAQDVQPEQVHRVPRLEETFCDPGLIMRCYCVGITLKFGFMSPM
jgi:hypothetical protein